ncbi:MAG: hypothetical protein COT73_07585 [Bdellovibrio sp. CG10_big_fil_rev_8_21_14_0_10_47_8]|nr:MAG: hypothetical protein COT73_07585 [Bdellovibrio sp. CG10_big_fil_rev_8_21_14_0_10_47_8]
MKLSDRQIDLLKQHWPIEGEVRFHRRVANFVYMTSLNGEEVVLRLTEPSHRKLPEIESELHWMSYLQSHGMKVAGPIRSSDGSLVVEISGETNYYAAIFQKAHGSSLADNKVLNNQTIMTWGQYLGKMHRLTKDYIPPATIQRRQNWDVDESLTMALRSLDRQDDLPYRRLNELMEWMKSLPRDKDCYGLIHCDLHRGNFFIKNDEMTAFDFDDACYQWFSYDIVPPVNSINRNLSEGNHSSEKEKALQSFLKGYCRENQLEQVWIDRISIFDKYRAALLYHWAKTCVKENVFGPEGIQWVKEKSPKLILAIQDPLKLF